MVAIIVSIWRPSIGFVVIISIPNISNIVDVYIFCIILNKIL
jgi:hypothetical protein